MKQLFPGLLIVGGFLGLMSGTDNHPPKVVAAPTVHIVETPRAEPVTTATAPNTTVEPSTPAVVSSKHKPHPFEGSVDAGNQCVVCWEQKSNPIHDNNAPHKFCQSGNPTVHWCLLCGKPKSATVHKDSGEVSYIEQGDAGGGAETGESDAYSKRAATSLPAFSPCIADMVTESNRLRAIVGKPQQIVDDRLCRAAQDQADYIARTGQLSHNVNGDPRSRAAKYGFPSGDFYSVREIIAPYAISAENAFSRWCKSSGHYAAIVSQHDLCGFGMADGPYGTMWVAVYGSEVEPPAPNLVSATRPQPVRRYTAPQSQAFCSGAGCGQSSGGYSSGGRFRIFRRR